MVLPNPKNTYKAQLLDYDALLLASDQECSYCLSEREIQMILAFVDYVGWKTRYIATETEIDVPLIKKWGDNLARKLMSGCCDEELHRFTEGGVYQSSDDGGATWHDDPGGDPRNDGTAAPPLRGEPSVSKRCAAADNVRGLFEQYRDNLIEIVGATPTILAIIAGILAFIGTILGVSGVGTAIGVLFLTMAAEMIQIGGTGISGAITFTALQIFRCLVYCRMNNDGQLTYEAWQGLLADIAGEFDGFAETFFYQTVNGMGYIGINNAATVGDSTASDCDDCDCTSCDNTADLAAQINFGTVTAQGTAEGHPYIEVESEFVSGSSVNVVRWGLIDTAAPPNMCCYFFDYVALEGEVLSTYWTDCAGSGHGSPNPAGHSLGHFDLYNASAPFKVRLLFHT